MIWEGRAKITKYQQQQQKVSHTHLKIDFQLFVCCISKKPNYDDHLNDMDAKMDSSICLLFRIVIFFFSGWMSVGGCRFSHIRIETVSFFIYNIVYFSVNFPNAFPLCNQFDRNRFEHNRAHKHTHTHCVDRKQISKYVKLTVCNHFWIESFIFNKNIQKYVVVGCFFSLELWVGDFDRI